MRDFSKISPAVWQSPRFNNLPSDGERLLYLYLLTSSHQTSAGCYQLPDGYACADLKWELERYRTARQVLVDSELILFDQENGVVMITRWFKHNPPMNEKHFIGIERMLKRLPSDFIREAAHLALNEARQSIESERASRSPRKQNAVDDAPNAQNEGIPGRLHTRFINRGS